MDLSGGRLVFEITRSITKEENINMAYVDYLLSTLVNKNVANLMKVMQREFSDVAHRKQFKIYLAEVKG